VFQGEHQMALDEKGRITIPSTFRKLIHQQELDRGLVLTHLPFEDERCVRIFPPKEWARKLAGLRKIAGENRQFMQVLMAHTQTADLDSQFRVLVPQRLLGYAHLERGTELVLVGAYNHIQVWNAERWRETVAATRPELQLKSQTIREHMEDFTDMAAEGGEEAAKDGGTV
jgi:MraZ protein